MKSRLIIILALLAVMLSACSLAEDITPPPNYQSPTPAPTMSPLFPQSAPDLASGAAIYAEKCSPCHGDTGMGDGSMSAKLQKAPPKIGSPEVARAAAPVNWYTTVTEGNMGAMMPPFKNVISDKQRWDVVAYVLSMGANTAVEAKAGQAVYEANCAQCHAAGGSGVQNADLADQALMAKLTQNDIASFINKGVGMMPGFGGIIPDEQIYAVAAYVRTFTVVEGEVVQAVAATATPEAAVTPTLTGSESTQPTPEGTPAAEVTPLATATPTEVIGTISGTITNGSGGSIPAGQKVILHAFSHDPQTQQFNEAGTSETELSSTGTYTFKKVPMPATQAFYISVEFGGAVYESEAAFAKDGLTKLDIPLTVYDTTTDASGLVIDQAHVLLDYSKQGSVQVVEFLVVSNPGNKAVVAAEKDGAVLNVPLPAGYSNLVFEQGSIGAPYLQTKDGFADVTPVTPGSGQYQLVFAVDLPLSSPGLFGGPSLKVAQLMSVKVNKLSVLVPEGISISDKGFTKGDLQDMGNGGKFQVYSSAPLEAGQTLSFTASGSLSASGHSASSTGGHQNIIIGVGAFGLALVIAGGWLFWRDRQRAEDEDEEEEFGDEAAGQDSEEIVSAIVALDDQYKAGNIQEEAYQRRRAELKAKLKDIL